MAYSNTNSEQIQRYVNSEMSAKERLAFEQAMADNETLRQEVNLYADMENFFSNTSEDDLRSNLKKLGDAYEASPPNEGSGAWGSLLWLFPILLLIGIGFFFLKDDDTKQTPPTEIENRSSTQETPPLPQANLDTPNDAIEITEATKTTSSTPPKSRMAKRADKATSTTRKEATPQLAAANFETNPRLDFLIKSTVRNATDTELIVRNTQANQKVSSVGEAVPFAFVANLRTRQDIARHNFKLHIFSNKKADFENFSPLHTFNIQPIPAKDNSYQIIVSNNLALKPGLYYYLLEDYAAEQTYFVEKFEVGI